MEERVRKVLHQDGASWNVTKLFSGRGDKLRLSPFYPMNAAQFAPREQNKDKLIKSKLTRLTNSGALSALSVFSVSTPDRALTWWRSHQWPLFLFFFLPRRRWFQPLVRRSGLTARPLSQKTKKKTRHTNPVRRPGRECAGGVCGWDCLTLAGLFVLVLFRQLLFKWR